MQEPFLFSYTRGRKRTLRVRVLVNDAKQPDDDREVAVGEGYDAFQSMSEMNLVPATPLHFQITGSHREVMQDHH